MRSTIDLDLVRGLGVRLDGGLRRLLRPREPVALIDFPNHANAGDSLIWLGELAWLRAAGHELVYAADRTVDQAERKRLLVQAQQRLADLLPELPLYSITKLDAVPAGLQNFRGNPTNTGVFWNVHEWEFR